MNQDLEFYFLRSFEQHIITQLCPVVFGLSEIEEESHLRKYQHFFGLTSKDIGIYAMHQNRIAGGAWVRLLKGDAKGQNRGDAYIDEHTPELLIAVFDTFRNQGIGKQIIHQLLAETARSYTQVSIALSDAHPALDFFKALGFELLEEHTYVHPVTQAVTHILLKSLEKPADEAQEKNWFERTQKWRMPQ